MAVEIFRKRSTESVSLIPLQELVTVGVHIDEAEKVTFSGGTQGNAVIVADPPILILTASNDGERLFNVTFRIETPGREFAEGGALRLEGGHNNKLIGSQIQRSSPTEVSAVFFNDLKGKDKYQGSFALGIPPLGTNAETAPSTVWHDPTILWEPPKG